VTTNRSSPESTGTSLHGAAARDPRRLEDLSRRAGARRCVAGRAGGRGAHAPRPERRRQVDADQGALRRHAPDHGEFRIDGRPVRIASPADGRRLGIAVIFQELSLVPYLTSRRTSSSAASLRAACPAAWTIAARTARHAPCSTSSASPSTRTRRAHARRRAAADGRDCQGPLAARAHPRDGRADGGALRARGGAALRDRPRAAHAGAGHHLHLAPAARSVRLGDRITVLRDGRRVASLRPAETSVDDLVRWMVGREVDTTYRHQFCERPGDVVLAVRDLHSDQRRARRHAGGARRRDRRARRAGGLGTQRAGARHLRRRPRHPRLGGTGWRPPASGR
jgi:hypothetical protein